MKDISLRELGGVITKHSPLPGEMLGMMTPGLATGHNSNKKETQNPLKASFQMILSSFLLVIRSRFELETPSLKGMCSTC